MVVMLVKHQGRVMFKCKIKDFIGHIVWSGCVDTTELKKAFQAMDVKVTDQEVDLLLKR